MLKKMVNGKEVVCSSEEEALIRQRWKMNDTYPEYSGHLAFDGVSPPYHLIEDCKGSHQKFINQIIAEKVKVVNEQLEIAIEDNNIANQQKLISRRKMLKSYLVIDFTNLHSINDLKNHLEMVKKV